MKYIKKFENIDDEHDYCWQIPTKQPKLRIALKKIGVNPDEIRDWCSTIEDITADYVLMFRTNSKRGGKNHWSGWSWSFLNYKKNPDFSKCKFMGKVKVEDWEIDAEKYNL